MEAYIGVVVGGPVCVKLSWTPFPPSNVAVHIFCITVVALTMPTAISVGHVSMWVLCRELLSGAARARGEGSARRDTAHASKPCRGR